MAAGSLSNAHISAVGCIGCFASMEEPMTLKMSSQPFRVNTDHFFNPQSYMLLLKCFTIYFITCVVLF